MAAAGAGRDNAAEHTDGGGFAGPVGPQESEDFSGSHGKRNPINRHKLTESFFQF